MAAENKIVISDEAQKAAAAVFNVDLSEVLKREIIRKYAEAYQQDGTGENTETVKPAVAMPDSRAVSRDAIQAKTRV